MSNGQKALRTRRDLAGDGIAMRPHKISLGFTFAGRASAHR